MSTPFLTTLSRHGRRRLGLGWMATTVMTADPRGFVRAATYNTQAGSPFEAMKELAHRVQQAELVRFRLRSELADEICASYKSLLPLKLPLSENCERTKILMFLASECSPTDDDVRSAVDDFATKRRVESDEALTTRLQTLTVSNLRKAATPSYEEILEYILKQDAANGMQFLVELRVDLLRALQWIRTSSKDDERFSHLESLDAYLLRLFSLWFSPGMLGKRSF